MEKISIDFTKDELKEISEDIAKLPHSLSEATINFFNIIKEITDIKSRKGLSLKKEKYYEMATALTLERLQALPEPVDYTFEANTADRI